VVAVGAVRGYTSAELFHLAETHLTWAEERLDADAALVSIAASLLVIARADVLRPDP
jgi:hypothetical protein